MEDRDVTDPRAYVEVQLNASWSASLEVFDQDFDTAMTIWSVQDPEVERLYVEGARVTRSRRGDGMASSQVIDWSQASDALPSGRRATKGRKRRRVTTNDEPEAIQQAPTPPFLSTTSGSQAMEGEVSQDWERYFRDPQSQASTQQLNSTADLTASSQIDRTAETPAYHLTAYIAAPHDHNYQKQNRTTGVQASASTDGGSVVVAGFSTGSGKSVSVSAEKLRAYEKLLTSAEDGVAANGPTVVHRHGSASTDGGSVVVAGFSTGSGKSVSVSAEKLRAYEKLLTSAEDGVAANGPTVVHRHGSASTDGGSVVVAGFSTGSGKSVSVSAEKLRAYEKLLTSAEDGVAANGPTVVHRHGSASTDGGSVVVAGFSTGSGKSVSVSAEKLRAYEKLLTSAEDGVAANGPTVVHRHGSASTDGGSVVVAGFSTGSGKSVSVSAEKLRAYEKLLTSAEDGVAANGPTVVHRHGSASTDGGSVVVAGFSTGSGKSVSVSAEKLRAYEKLLTSAEDGVAANGPTVVHRHGSASTDGGSVVVAGFSTGSGKSVSVSAEKLRAYEKLLTSAEDGVAANGPTVVHRHGSASTDGGSVVVAGFSTGSGKSVSVSAEKLRAYEKLLTSAEDGVAANGPTVVHRHGSASTDGGSVVVAGFSTGSGKSVSVSAEKLRAYEKLLTSAEDGVAANGPTVVHRHGSASTDGGSVVVAGFSTGSGKSVSVSAEKLRAYEKLLTSAEDGVAANGPTVVHRHGSASTDGGSVVVAGFSTGSGKSVSVSAEKLRAYEKLLTSAEDGVAANGPTVVHRHGSASTDGGSVVVAGFSTGSGKSVSVSAEKLRAYEKLLTSAEDGVAANGPTVVHRHGSASTDGGSVVVAGFSTGSGKSVSVSAEKLRAYEKLLTSAEDGVAANGPTVVHRHGSASTDGGSVVVAGFSTGSGKSVSVSAEKLRAYEKLLSSADDGMGSKSEAVVAHGESLAKEVGSGPVVTSYTSAGVEKLLFHQHDDDQFTITAAKESRRSIDSVPTKDSMISSKRRHSLPPVGRTLQSTLTPSIGVSAGVNAVDTGGTTSKRPGSNPDDGYSTPAKKRHKSVAPSNLSAKKGFRPPVPLKTLPVKSIVTPPKSNASAAHKTAQSFSQPQVIASIRMQYHEMMRVSRELLVSTSGLDNVSPMSHRRDALSGVTAVTALNISFCVADDSQFMITTQGIVEESCESIFAEMTRREYFSGASNVSQTWFRNHFRWVVWKLATMELEFPRFLFGRYLTKHQVMYQLCHRHRRDLVLSQRSIIKKVLNRDTSAGSCMILRVAAVLPYPIEDEKDIDIIPSPQWKLAIVLTDGWYGLYAVPDISLADSLWKAHKRGKLVGMKIVTWGSSLQNSTDGVDPLECALACEAWTNPLTKVDQDPSRWPYLKLNSNSTRPASKHARLGLEKLVRCDGKGSTGQSEKAFDFVWLKSVPMRSLDVGGGIVRSVRVRVVKASPVMYLQSKEFTIGPRILCEEHMQQYHQARYDYLSSKRAEHDGDEPPSAPLPVPFLKLEVICSHDQMSVRKAYGVLSVWRPSDDMLAALKEGQEYYVSSVSISWRVDYGPLGVFIRCGTTKGSTFEHIQPNEEFQATSQRACQTVESLVSSFSDHSSSMPTELKLSGDVCVIVLCVQEGQAPPANMSDTITTTDHVFVTDKSCRLMSLRIPTTRIRRQQAKQIGTSGRASIVRTTDYVFRRGSKTLWSEGAVVCINGLEVSHYDERLGLLDCELTESAKLVSLPSKKSMFHDDAVELRRLWAGSDQACAQFRKDVLRLKKYVQRSILLLDYELSQQEVLTQGNSVEASQCEADQLTQELAGCSSSDGVDWVYETTPTITTGCIMGIVNLNDLHDRSQDQDAEALVYVKAESDADDDGLRTVYLGREVMDELIVILRHAADIPSADSSLDELVAEEKTKSVELRFDTLWHTSERLLNSWKSWERDSNATFLVATKVSASK